MLEEILGKPVVLLSKLNSSLISLEPYEQNTYPYLSWARFTKGNPFDPKKRNTQWIIELMKPGIYLIRNLQYSNKFLTGDEAQSVQGQSGITFWDTNFYWNIILNGQRNEYSFVNLQYRLYMSSDWNFPVLRPGNPINLPQAIWQIHHGHLH